MNRSLANKLWKQMVGNKLQQRNPATLRVGMPEAVKYSDVV